MSPMPFHLDAFFERMLKQRANTKMRKLVAKKLKVFAKNPHDPSLDNHALDHAWKGFHSIDVTPDWLLIYRVKRGQRYTFMTCGDKTRLLRPWTFNAKPDWEFFRKKESNERN